jgi:hypothetical protein
VVPGQSLSSPSRHCCNPAGQQESLCGPLVGTQKIFPAGIPQIKPTFLDMSPSRMARTVLRHPERVNCPPIHSTGITHIVPSVPGEPHFNSTRPSPMRRLEHVLGCRYRSIFTFPALRYDFIVAGPAEEYSISTMRHTVTPTGALPMALWSAQQLGHGIGIWV